MDIFEQAHELRQQVLDFINLAPHVNNAAIAARFGIKIDHAGRTTNKMERSGEIMRHGTGHSITWTALKKVTTSADEMRTEAYDKRRKTHKERVRTERDEKERKRENGSLACKVYRHTPDMPLKNQGGQGATGKPTSSGMYGAKGW